MSSQLGFLSEAGRDEPFDELSARIFVRSDPRTGATLRNPMIGAKDSSDSIRTMVTDHSLEDVTVGIEENLLQSRNVNNSSSADIVRTAPNAGKCNVATCSTRFVAKR